MERAIELPRGFGQSGLMDQPLSETASGDAAVVSAARSGDRSAFGRLYDRYARMVHGILLARVPPGDVDDLVQDVFLQALRRLRSLRDVSAFGGWLAMIARNRANDYHRRSPRENRPEASVPSESQGGNALREELAPPRSPAAQNRAEALVALEAIRSLPEAYRETLILRLVEGMTGPEIAARTGLTPASVRVNLHRGMKHLRAKLGKEE